MEVRKCKCCGRELPVENFSFHAVGRGSGVERMYTCKECVSNKLRESRKVVKDEKVKSLKKEVADARSMKLQDFSPRELMSELARRGYKGKLAYEIEIDITNF